MAVIIVSCHNLACKSLPEWKRRGGRKELILVALHLHPLAAFGAEPEALKAFFIMCPSKRRRIISSPSVSCHFNYPALVPYMQLPSFPFSFILHFVFMPSMLVNFIDFLRLFCHYLLPSCPCLASLTLPCHLTPTQQQFRADLHC